MKYDDSCASWIELEPTEDKKHRKMCSNCGEIINKKKPPKTCPYCLEKMNTKIRDN